MLSAGSVVTDANGLASVTATANATAGTYAVTASAADVTLASYNLTNQIQPIFSDLIGQTVTYGSTVTFTGTLAAGAQVPDGEEVAVTVVGITHNAEIGSDGSFSAQFTGVDVVLNANSTAYNVSYTYSTDGVFLAADGSSQLTVNPVPLTVRANNVSTLYGSPPALTDTITGFVGGDNSSVVSGAPVMTTTAAAGANAGAYPITIAAGTLSATNYIFPAADLIAGTLTVTPAPLVITAVSTSMIAGQSVPTLAAVYSGFKNGDTPASLTLPPILHSAVSPSSAPGNYLITASGASSPNYMITYVPGTLTVILAPATVESVSVEKVKLSKHKTVQEIVLQFSKALDSATAQSISSYILATVPKNKKQKSKPVPLSSASYNPSALTVTLVTRKKLALNPPLELTVRAASLLDALGRELDGNDSGHSGANFMAIFSKAGTSVTSAMALA
jgi:MBG domain (YGX type)